MPAEPSRSKLLFHNPGVLDACVVIAQMDEHAKRFENKDVLALAEINSSALSTLLSKLVRLGHLKRVATTGAFARVDDGFWKVMLDLESVWEGMPPVTTD